MAKTRSGCGCVCVSIPAPTPLSRCLRSVVLKCGGCGAGSSLDFVARDDCMEAVIACLEEHGSASNMIFRQEGAWRKIVRNDLGPLLEVAEVCRLLHDLHPNLSHLHRKFARDPVRAYIGLKMKSLISGSMDKQTEDLIRIVEGCSLIRRYRADVGLSVANRPQVYKEILRDIEPVYAPEAYRSKMLDAYSFGPYGATIWETTIGEPYLQTYPLERDPRLEEVTSFLSDRLRQTVEKKELFQKTGEVIETRVARAHRIAQGRFAEGAALDSRFLSTCVLLAAFRSLRMLNLAPLLADQQIEEIYLDDAKSPIYVDHRRWGRCVTSLFLGAEEVEAFSTRCGLESNKRLDEANPSLKTEIITKIFHVRASIDVAPLSVGGTAISIRKLRKRFFTLPELIANGTITSQAAAYLIYSLRRRRNIGVVGEPGSGKTTLASSLLATIPKNWRTIYIEDVIETEDLRPFGVHQLKFRVDPVESLTKTSRMKSREIVKLLHRTPTYVFLGEIQTSEHSQALFHSMSAGIKVMFTVHADSVHQLIKRWVIQHGINPASISSLDILIVVGRENLAGMGPRKVMCMYELCKGSHHNGSERIELRHGSVWICPVYLWTRTTGLQPSTVSLSDTPCVSATRRFEQQSPEEFENEFSSVQEVLERLAAQCRFDLPTLRNAMERTRREEMCF